MESFEVKGKVALVTGGARGIGLETARALHDKGASVVIVDLDAGDAERAAEAIGSSAIGVGADVTDLEAMQGAVKHAVEQFGGLDLVVANAGIGPPAATVRAMDPELFDRVIEVNVLGVHRTVLAALPQLTARRGHVVVVSSMYAHANGMLGAAYGASKAAVAHLGRSLRVELAHHGVSVSVAYWGFIDTPLAREAFAGSIGERLLATFPRPLVRTIEPEVAAAATVRGVERRAPRIIAPRRWVPVFRLNGLIMPLWDRRFERHARLQTLMREADRVEPAAPEQAGRAR